MTAQVLHVCHLCRHVSDGSRTDERWVTKQAYRQKTGIDPATCFMTYIYCPACFQCMATMKDSLQPAFVFERQPAHNPRFTK
jgi:hypothetical protein